MSFKTVYGRGRAQIEISGALARHIDETLKRLLPTARDVIHREVEGLYQHAHDNWPVKTGVSKAGLERGVRVTSEGVEGFVRNTVDYAVYIRQPWPYNNKFVLRELIIKPGKRRAKVIAEAVRKDLYGD